MATAFHYNISTFTRQPLLLPSSGLDAVILTTHPHFHSLNENNTLTKNSSHNRSIHLLPSWLDPTAYGERVGFYHFSGDVQQLTVPWVREPNFIPLVVVQVLTFVLGITGNSLVISVLCCGRPSRCVTFPCLLSMAVADVLFLAVCVPHEIVGHFLTHWGASSYLCKLSGFVEMVSALAAVLNLILISMERYFVIAHPLMSKSLCTTRKAKIALIATWVAAFLFSAPAFVFMDTEVNVYYNNTSHAEVVLCGDYGLHNTGRMIWAAWQLVLLFAFPALLLLFCYTRVIFILWTSTRQLQNMTASRFSSTNSSGRNTNGSREAVSSGWKVTGADRSLLATPSSSSASQLQQTTAQSKNPGEEALQARKQVIRMLVVIIVVFLVCWGPHLTINLIKRLELKVYTESAYHVWVMFSCLPYVQSVINPVIYILMSKKIREAICSTPCVRCVLACCSRQHVRHSTTHELLTATSNHSAGGAGMKIALETMRSYGASELTEV